VAEGEATKQRMVDDDKKRQQQTTTQQSNSVWEREEEDGDSNGNSTHDLIYQSTQQSTNDRGEWIGKR
jgi:hypothetical protein